MTVACASERLHSELKSLSSLTALNVTLLCDQHVIQQETGGVADASLKQSQSQQLETTLLPIVWTWRHTDAVQSCGVITWFINIHSLIFSRSTRLSFPAGEDEHAFDFVEWTKSTNSNSLLSHVALDDLCRTKDKSTFFERLRSIMNVKRSMRVIEIDSLGLSDSNIILVFSKLNPHSKIPTETP